MFAFSHPILSLYFHFTYLLFLSINVLAAAPDILPQLIPHVFHMYINISIHFFLGVFPIVPSLLSYRHTHKYLQDFPNIPNALHTYLPSIYIYLLSSRVVLCFPIFDNTIFTFYLLILFSFIFFPLMSSLQLQTCPLLNIYFPYLSMNNL